MTTEHAKQIIPAAPDYRLPLEPDGFGIVTRDCGDRGEQFHVDFDAGRMLRVGDIAYLCFDCGPEGGVYHPERPRCAPGDHDGPCDCETHTMADVRADVAQ